MELTVSGLAIGFTVGIEGASSASLMASSMDRRRYWAMPKLEAQTVSQLTR